MISLSIRTSLYPLCFCGFLFLCACRHDMMNEPRAKTFS